MQRDTLIIVALAVAVGFLFVHRSPATVVAGSGDTPLYSRPLGAARNRDAETIAAVSAGISNVANAIGSWFSK